MFQNYCNNKKEFWSKLVSMEGEERKEFWLKVFKIYSIYMIICLIFTFVYYVVSLKMISKQQKSDTTPKEEHKYDDEFIDLDLEKDWDE